MKEYKKLDDNKINFNDYIYYAEDDDFNDNKIICKINDFLKNIKYKYYNIVDGIQNIIRWFPIIWKDRDFDHSFFFRILIKKLEFIYYRYSHPKECNVFIVQDEEYWSYVKRLKKVIYMFKFLNEIDIDCDHTYENYIFENKKGYSWKNKCKLEKQTFEELSEIIGYFWD